MASDPASSPTVEEALRSAAARFALLADVLELQAIGIERATSPLARKALKRWGQYTIIVPTHDLVIVRRGLDYGRQGFDRWSLTREVLKAFELVPAEP